jgi:uncharacterized damage-inducible protein DinB
VDSEAARLSSLLANYHTTKSSNDALDEIRAKVDAMRKLRFCSLLTICISLFSSIVVGSAAGEYDKRFAALSQLSVAVAQAMPAESYSFRPHPESMTFGDLMMHIAGTNYAFCAGLKDANAPTAPSVSALDREGVVKFLSDSFSYCATIIPNLTEEQLSAVHNSPDGRLPGRGILLAMFVHVAHHRGQAEIYLRDKGIKPPSYRI